MGNAKRTREGIISCDGVSFEWRLHREPQWCSADGWRGLVIVFRGVDGFREAFVEWPMPKSGSHSAPYRQRPKIDRRLLERGLRSALAADWDPLSRGRPITILVD